MTNCKVVYWAGFTARENGIDGKTVEIQITFII
jgi:hypothetical protein